MLAQDACPTTKREDDCNLPKIRKDHPDLPTRAGHLTLRHLRGTNLDHFLLGGFQSREDVLGWSSSIAVHLVVEPLSGVEP
jgi:hypothetical protein